MSEESWIEIWSVQLFFVSLHHNKTIKNMDLKQALEEIKAKVSTETNISLNINGLQVEVSGYSHLAQTCWLTFVMKDLGKLIGKDYIEDEYVIELANWNAVYKVEEIVNKINKRK